MILPAQPPNKGRISTGGRVALDVGRDEYVPDKM